MDILHPRCAGLDISKTDAKVCVRVAQPAGGVDEKVTTWGSMTEQILGLLDHLVAQRVTCVVMEATGDYWKPFYYLLEDGPFEVMLVNAQHVKTVPGRKTDVCDARWLAQLAAHGLVRASLVPAEPIRQLRDLTRTRVTLTRERTSEILRLEKVLEDAGIKLSVVASKVLGASTRLMLEALIAGERDPEVLADLAKTRLRAKIAQLRQALVGRFNDHHAFLVRLHLELIDQHTKAIERLTARIEVVIAPFQAFRDLATSLPGVSTLIADVITAETAADMTAFPTAAHLASWAGVCPGNHQSAGTIKSTHTLPGNRHLKAALGIAAMTCSRQHGTYLSTRYRRIASRKGPSKANIATQHNLLTALWHMSTTGELYHDPGADYYTRHTPEKTKNRAITQLQNLGYTITLTPTPTP